MKTGVSYASKVILHSDRSQFARTVTAMLYMFKGKVGVTRQDRMTSRVAGNSSFLWRQSTSDVSDDYRRPRTSLGLVRCDRVFELENGVVKRTTLANKTPSSSSRCTTPRDKTRRRIEIPTTAPYTFLFRHRANIVTGKSKEVLDEDTVNNENRERNLDDRSNYDHRNGHVENELVSRLRQEIDDLVLAIEEEKLNHKETKQAAAENLKWEVERLVDQRVFDISRCNEEYEQKLTQLRELYRSKVDDCERDGIETAANLTKKLATIQSAFDAYKLQLKEEIDAQFEKCLAERRQFYERQMKKETDKLRRRHSMDTAARKAQMENEFSDAFRLQRRTNNRTLQDMMERIGQRSVDLAKLEYMNNKVKELQADVEAVNRRCQLAAAQLSEAQKITESLERKVKIHEETLEERIEHIDQKYHDRIEQLRQQIDDAQLQYLNRAAEVHRDKRRADEALHRRVENAKTSLRAVIESKNKRKSEGHPTPTRKRRNSVA